MTATEAAAPPPTGAGTRRLAWRQAEVVERVAETRRATTLVLDVPDWPGHSAGQHVDVRLTAEDGYQAQRSYSIASPPEVSRLALTVERLEGGEVSPWLVDEARPGDRFELRGPIGGYFAWSVTAGGPLLLVAGGSGVAPLMAMLRHRAASDEAGRAVPARLLLSRAPSGTSSIARSWSGSGRRPAGPGSFTPLRASRRLRAGAVTPGGSTRQCWPRSGSRPQRRPRYSSVARRRWWKRLPGRWLRSGTSPGA
jgi:hypothetical protein